MGTDIHAVVQRRKNGQWITYAEGYESRNYDVFSILADVRNGHGFAGCKTGDGFKPISAPKGIPTDLVYVGNPTYPSVAVDGGFRPFPGSYRDQYKEEKTYNLGDHSHSWLTLDELLSIDMGSVVKKFGCVSAPDFEKIGDYFKKYRHEPKCSYFGGVSGPNTITMEESDYLVHKQLNTLPEGKDIHVQTWWNETYGEALGLKFSLWLIQLLKDALQFGCDLKSIRVVFGFDS